MKIPVATNNLRLVEKIWPCQTRSPGKSARIPPMGDPIYQELARITNRIKISANISPNLQVKDLAFIKPYITPLDPLI